MTNETTPLYQCPICQEDVTQKVNEAAEEIVVWPDALLGANADGPATPREVTIQCANGHWAKYPVWRP